MSTGHISKNRLLIVIGVIYFLTSLSIPIHASSMDRIKEHIFLIDTSSSMNNPRGNSRLSQLRVAVDDYADTIPIDGSSRIWIFTFDNGLNKSFFQGFIRQTEDLQRAKVHLSGIEAAGSATHIFRSLDGIFTEVEKTLEGKQIHDFVIRLFTDGEDNQGAGIFGGKKQTFQDNVNRFVQLRDRNDKIGGSIELYYHALDVKVSGSIEKLIQDTEGINLISGIQMPPRADFDLPESVLYDNTAITFINKTIGKADTFNWSFGDGNTSDKKDPTHTFHKPGLYDVQLTVANQAGENTISRQITVEGGPPQARFIIKEPEKTKYVNQPVSFEDRSLGQIESWAWDFGDGQGKSTETNPTYIYKQPGRYKVVLKLKGLYGENELSEDSDFINITQPSVLKFSFYPEQPKHGQKIIFTNESIGEYQQWSWEFGGGSTSNEHSPQHTYIQEGEYTVTLKGLNVLGEWKTVTQSLIVESGYIPPEANFGLTVKTLDMGEQFTILDQSTGTVEEWRWDMGDGTIIKTKNAKHKYIKGGTFTITLTVSGPAGTDSTKAQIEVRQTGLAFSLGTKEPKHNMPVVFVNESVGDFKDWEWNFGDSSTENNRTPDAHIYKEQGNYTVTLSATGPDGKRQTVTREIIVQTSDVQPVASFVYKPEEPEAGEKIGFIFDGEGTVTRYEWNMGDGNEPAGGSTIDYVFEKPGEYKVTLQVSNDSGQQDSCEKLVTVRDPFEETQISFRIKKDSETDTDYTIEIENNCIGSIKKYLWDFGDGTTTDDEEPQHTYTKKSQKCQYVITLKVIDQKNQEKSSTESQNIMITVRAKPVIPAKYQYLTAGVLYFIMLIVFKLQPYHKRTFRYQVNDERRKMYKSWTKDKRFLWQKEEQRWGKDKDSCTDGFEVRMIRDWLLSKRYYFKELKGRIKAARMNQKPLVNNRLEHNSLVTVGDSNNEIVLTKFNDGISSWLMPHLCIVVFIVCLLALGLKYLA